MGDLPALRFHSTCFYRVYEGAPRETWPALLAAVTDPDGVITGVLRTWLARDGSGKAPLATPRRSLGRLLGSGARFGKVTDVLAAGEGLETMLSLRVVMPALPVVAALSATHLAAFIPPSGLRRLYIPLRTRLAEPHDQVGFAQQVCQQIILTFQPGAPGALVLPWCGGRRPIPACPAARRLAMRAACLRLAALTHRQVTGLGRGMHTTGNRGFIHLDQAAEFLQVVLALDLVI